MTTEKENNRSMMKEETQSETKSPSQSTAVVKGHDPEKLSHDRVPGATANESASSGILPSSFSPLTLAGYAGKAEDEDVEVKFNDRTSPNSFPNAASIPTKERNNSGLFERLSNRIRKMSEPSDRAGEGEFNSQRSLSKKSIPRQDSMGSSLRKRSSVSSNPRISIVEAMSIFPTLGSTISVNHDQLFPNDDDDDDDDDEFGGTGRGRYEDDGSRPRSNSMKRRQDVEFPDLLTSDEMEDGDVNLTRRPSHHMPQIYEQAEGEPADSGTNHSGGMVDPKDVKKQLVDDEMTDAEREVFNKKERRKYMKNLLVLCTGFFFIFTAFLSLRNLQSSLNAKGGLGMYALSATYACFFLGCIFATTIVQRLGPKRSIVISTSGLFLYVIANFYPLFYTLIPAAAAAGFCQGVIWTAHATYIANIAVSYTALTDEKIQNVLSRFNGIFFVFYQSCQIIGGLISSIILKSPPDDMPGYYTNGTFVAFNETAFGNGSYEMFVFDANVTAPKSPGYSQCGRNYCPYSSGGKGAAPVDRTLVFILVGIFTVSAIAGIFTLAFLLDPLDGQMKKKKGSIPKQLSAVFRFYCHRHAVCLVGLMFYSLLQAAFMFGEYTKAFVTCTLGIHMVGFVMLTLSFSSAIAAFFNGRIQKYSGRPPLLATAAIFQMSVFLTLLFWQPTPATTPVFFILVVFWGMGDGIIMTQDISLIGFLFANNKEPAFAALKMTQSIANFTFFMVSPYTCTVHKIFGVGTVLVIATTGYFILEGQLLFEKRKEKKKASLQLQ